MGERGFTLVEVLVVLVMVSIIAIGSYTLLDAFNSTDRALEIRAEELRRFSMALYRLEDDLRQITARPVKNAYSGYEPALRGDADELEFTRLGAANLTGEPRGELQRLAYSIGFLEDEDSHITPEEDMGAILLRSRWQVLDRAPDTEPIVEPLLSGVEALSLRYYDPDTETWLNQWPPVTSQTSITDADRRLPAAIELVLVTRSAGELRRIFSLPQAEVTAGGGSNSSAADADGDGGSRSGESDDD